jgi:hypothetical protein
MSIVTMYLLINLIANRFRIVRNTIDGFLQKSIIDKNRKNLSLVAGS